MLELTIKGNSITEIHNKIISTAHELGTPVAVPAYKPVEIAQEVLAASKIPEFVEQTKVAVSEAIPKLGVAPRSEAGNVVSEGKEWVPHGNGFAGVPINTPAPTPTTSPTTPAYANTVVERDSKGMPWDARIHAATKTKCKDGTWKYLRGTQDDFINQIEAELAATHGLQTPTKKVAPFGSMAADQYAKTVAPAAHPETPKAYENAAIPTDVKPAHTLETFKANFPMTITTLINTGKLTQDYISALNAHFGLSNIMEILKYDTKLTDLFNGFVEHGLVTKVG